MTDTLAAPDLTGADLPGDYPARARSLTALIDSEADAIESGGTLTRPVVEALVEREIFWALVPRELGGAGLGIVESLKMVEELARADGSVGWAVMSNAFSTGIAAGFLSDQGARDLFAGAQRGITAGMILPTGSGRRVEGGYRVTGRYGFGSGTGHASWIGAGFVVQTDEGTPELDANGGPVCRVAFVPRDEVEFLAGWDVMGMEGTGSYDYAVTDLFVPEAHTMDTFSTVPTRPEPVFRLGLLGIGVGGHAPVALGIAQRALEEIARIASAKSRPGYATVVGDSPMFRREFMTFEALLQAARRYVYDAHADAEATAVSGQEITAEQRARLRQVTTWVQQVARDVVTFAYSWGGSASIRNPSVLGRCLRDISVGAQHLLVEPMTLVEAADAILPTYVTQD
ncbi:acyl-CoA dehydrogenase family protein [Actinomycetospora sp. OC33-EN08]|uniref:Acyl-CoA dehydrogenase family protein n=1 Tax=Actinomycetospora aurantiaca TaxID=3129233 RepID=A0ABU8MKC5_9PSEU